MNSIFFNKGSEKKMVKEKRSLRDYRQLMTPLDVIATFKAGDSFESIASTLKNYDREVSHDFISFFTNWYRENPAEACHMLENVSLLLLKQGVPEIGILHLNVLSKEVEIPSIERKLYTAWMRDSPLEPLKMLEDFGKRAVSDEILPFYEYSHQISMLSSLYLNEHKNNLEDFTNWASKRNSNNYIKGYVARGLSKHMTKEHTFEVGNYIRKNFASPLVRAGAMDYLDALDKISPQEGIDWISSLDLVEFTPHLVGRYLANIAERDPEQVRNLLNDDTFLERVIPKGRVYNEQGEITSESKDIFDSALEAYLNSFSHVDPILAREQSLHFYDNKKRVKLEKKLNDMITVVPPSWEAHQNSLKK